VLLTCSGTRVDMVLAFQAALAREGRGGRVIVADASDLAPSRFFAEVAASVPSVGDPGYVDRVIELARDHGARVVLPLTDLDQALLTARRAEFAAVGAQVIASDPETCEICLDKYAAHRLFAEHGIGSPWTKLADELPAAAEIPFPVLVKAREGFAARNIWRANDAAELAFFLSYTPAASMVQQVCDGHEISTDVICDLSGRCIEAVPRSMIESKGGETIKGTSLDDAEVRAFAVRVAETLGIKGPACVQVFVCADGIRVTDVNPRFGGGFPLHVAAGGGFPDIVLALGRGEHPEPRVGSYEPGVTMLRFLSQVIVTRDAGGALRPAADRTGVRTEPAL
jgi:carbamoyl-phosphate synthase large subunit